MWVRVNVRSRGLVMMMMVLVALLQGDRTRADTENAM